MMEAREVGYGTFGLIVSSDSLVWEGNESARMAQSFDWGK